MKKLQTSEAFKVGTNNIGWVGSDFKKHFYPMSFTTSKAELETKVLDRSMLDKEIFAELKPEAVTLGNMLNFLSFADKDVWYLFYVNDAKGTLWAVDAAWSAGSGGWGVGADSVEGPNGWRDGDQVVSRRFSATQNKTLGTLDPLTLVSEIEERLKKLKAILK